jgi:hypothetical protein
MLVRIGAMLERNITDAPRQPSPDWSLYPSASSADALKTGDFSFVTLSDDICLAARPPVNTKNLLLCASAVIHAVYTGNKMHFTRGEFQGFVDFCSQHTKPAKGVLLPISSVSTVMSKLLTVQFKRNLNVDIHVSRILAACANLYTHTLVDNPTPGIDYLIDTLLDYARTLCDDNGLSTLFGATDLGTLIPCSWLLTRDYLDRVWSKSGPSASTFLDDFLSLESSECSSDSVVCDSIECFVDAVVLESGNPCHLCQCAAVYRCLTCMNYFCNSINDSHLVLHAETFGHWSYSVAGVTVRCGRGHSDIRCFGASGGVRVCSISSELSPGAKYTSSAFPYLQIGTKSKAIDVDLYRRSVNNPDAAFEFSLTSPAAFHNNARDLVASGIPEKHSDVYILTAIPDKNNCYYFSGPGNLAISQTSSYVVDCADGSHSLRPELSMLRIDDRIAIHLPSVSGAVKLTLSTRRDLRIGLLASVTRSVPPVLSSLLLPPRDVAALPSYDTNHGLNESQKDALFALRHKSHGAIVGPPGSGKSSLIANFCSSSTNARILVVTLSHEAADNVFESAKRLCGSEARRYNPPDRVNDKPIRSTFLPRPGNDRIIFSTIASLPGVAYASLADIIIVDEASQVGDGDLAVLLAAIRNRCPRIFFVGDPMQNKPILGHAGVSPSHASLTCFMLSKTNLMLNVNYRSPQNLVENTSRCFYKGKLRSHRTDSGFLAYHKANSVPVAAKIVARDIDARSLDPAKCVLITHLNAHRLTFANEFENRSIAVRCITIDSSQGREYEHVFLYLPLGRPEFNSPARINVGTSRSKSSLVVLYHEKIQNIALGIDTSQSLESAPIRHQKPRSSPVIQSPNYINLHSRAEGIVMEDCVPGDDLGIGDPAGVFSVDFEAVTFYDKSVPSKLATAASEVSIFGPIGVGFAGGNGHPCKLNDNGSFERLKYNELHAAKQNTVARAQIDRVKEMRGQVAFHEVARSLKRRLAQQCAQNRVCCTIILFNGSLDRLFLPDIAAFGDFKCNCGKPANFAESHSYSCLECVKHPLSVVNPRIINIKMLGSLQVNHDKHCTFSCDGKSHDACFDARMTHCLFINAFSKTFFAQSEVKRPPMPEPKFAYIAQPPTIRLFDRSFFRAPGHPSADSRRNDFLFKSPACINGQAVRVRGPTACLYAGDGFACTRCAAYDEQNLMIKSACDIGWTFRTLVDNEASDAHNELKYLAACSSAKASKYLFNGGPVKYVFGSDGKFVGTYAACVEPTSLMHSAVVFADDLKDPIDQIGGIITALSVGGSLSMLLKPSNVLFPFLPLISCYFKNYYVCVAPSAQFSLSISFFERQQHQQQPHNSLFFLKDSIERNSVPNCNAGSPNFKSVAESQSALGEMWSLGGTYHQMLENTFKKIQKSLIPDFLKNLKQHSQKGHVSTHKIALKLSASLISPSLDSFVASLPSCNSSCLPSCPLYA